MRRRLLFLLGGLGLFGACDPTACDPGSVGCGGDPIPSTSSRRPAAPQTRPSRAQVKVKVVGRDPEPEYDSEFDGEPEARPRPAPSKPSGARRPANAAPRRKPPPPPRLKNGVWQYSTAARLLDEYLGGKKKSRFKTRVRVTGRIKRVIDMGTAGGIRLWLDGGAGRFVEARFRDKGQSAARRRRGQTVTVECVARSAIGKNAQLGDCRLR